MAFAAVFEYAIEAEGAAAFEAAYGPDGDWARFFRTGDGYLGTDLWRAAGGRYLLVDRWESAAAYEAFLAANRDEYRRRSTTAESLYRAERELGRFGLVHPSSGA
jgi:heme-degrading monooxygenase HmoA